MRLLMGFVDDDGVISVEETVTLHLRQQNTIGHELDRGCFGNAVIETNGVTNRLAQVLAQFIRDTLSDSAGS